MKNVKKVYFYSLYERLWHWMQALLVIALIITGFEITFATFFSLTGFKAAVYLHNIVALIFVANAFLALFYNLASGLLTQWIPGLQDFFSLGFRHARYYYYGIFRGEPHPFEKTPEKRLLPLQKITYFVILNLLVPVQVVTGLLKWSASYDPGIIDSFGGLKLIATIHLGAAWLFILFTILHVYMTTTGHTVFSSIAAMITGYDIVEVEKQEEEKEEKAEFSPQAAPESEEAEDPEKEET